MRQLDSVINRMQQFHNEEWHSDLEVNILSNLASISARFNNNDGTTSGSGDGPVITSSGNAINITIIDSGIGITSGNGNASGDIQVLDVVSVLQVAAAIQLGAALVLPLSVMVVPHMTGAQVS